MTSEVIVQVPPCPDWCTLPGGHDYDSVTGVANRFGSSIRDGGLRMPVPVRSFVRSHEMSRDGDVSVVQEESQFPDGSVKRGQPFVAVYVDTMEPLTAAQAVTLGEALLGAAEAVERVS